MKPQPKFVTKLFAAIDGYTETKALSEQQALALSNTAREKVKPLIEGHNGVWIYEKDGEIFANFAKPEQAVECAVAIQQALHDERELKLRIGIHTGDIKSGAGAGDIVASHIAEMAAPGGICISDKVYAAVQNKVDVKGEFLEETSIEGVERLIRVYALVGEGLAESGSVASTDRQTQQASVKPSIAVLPFINMSADPEQAYFCDGMAEEIINALTHIENLHVVARTSAFSFKGKDIDVREIGHKLDVAHVLEGSVRKAGNRLRITAQLVKVEDGYHLWSERFDRTMEDVFAIQDEISLAVVSELKVRLLKAEETAMVKRHTVDTEAYELYLKGLYYFNRRIEGGPKRGIEYFQQAIEKDPHYALAYTGIADCYILMGLFGFIPHREAFSQAKIAIDKSLELDDMLGEAHVSLGQYKNYFKWDFHGPEKDFKHALELNPNYALAHTGYSNLLVFIGRLDESITEMQRALQLDPLSVRQNSLMGFTYSLSRRYDEAMEYYQKALEIDPYFPSTYWYQGIHFTGLKKWDDAITSFQNFMTLTAGSPVSIGHLGFAYAMAGQKDKALQLLKQLEKISQEQYVSPYYKALVYIGFGDKDLAFAYLDKAYTEHEPMLALFKINPLFDSIRDDPRFHALLKKIGLPED